MSESKVDVKAQLKHVLDGVRDRDPDQKEFYEAIDEVSQSLLPLFEKRPHYIDVLKAMVEPERAIQFRVTWVDDGGNMQVNRGYRVQFNSAIGPYKGGLRFHPSVNLSIVKFLGFEQTFKNSLTTLPMGGGKGGSDFDPKGKSDREVLRFCQSFMTELYRHIGPDTDVPAGDIGVGGREIGFLLGQYKRIRNLHTGGVLTGKGTDFFGSHFRTEATGYGVVYLTKHYLEYRKDDFKDKRCLVSGSGNVAQYLVEKLIEVGAKPVTMSDSSGYIYEEDGITQEQLEYIKELKNKKRGRLSEYAEWSKSAKYEKGKKPWGVKGDIAFPAATQNEIEEDDAKQLVQGGVKIVCEAANMPSTADAIKVYKSNDLGYLPAKAANAGGVAVSGLEMSQNSVRQQWEGKDVDEKLQSIMRDIFEQMRDAAKDLGSPDDMQLGANAAGFIRVAESMLAQGQAFSSS